MVGDAKGGRRRGRKNGGEHEVKLALDAIPGGINKLLTGSATQQNKFSLYVTTC